MVRVSNCVVAEPNRIHLVSHGCVGGGAFVWCATGEGPVSARDRIAMKRELAKAAPSGFAALLEAARHAFGPNVQWVVATIGPDGLDWALEGLSVGLWGHGLGRLEGSGHEAAKGLLVASGGFQRLCRKERGRWASSGRSPVGLLHAAMPTNMCVAAKLLQDVGESGGAFCLATLQ